MPKIVGFDETWGLPVIKQWKKRIWLRECCGASGWCHLKSVGGMWKRVAITIVNYKNCNYFVLEYSTILRVGAGGGVNQYFTTFNYLRDKLVSTHIINDPFTHNNTHSKKILRGNPIGRKPCENFLNKLVDNNLLQTLICYNLIRNQLEGDTNPLSLQAPTWSRNPLKFISTNLKETPIPMWVTTHRPCTTLPPWNR